MTPTPILSYDELAHLLQRLLWRGVLSDESHLAVLCAPYSTVLDHVRCERMILSLYFRPRFAAQERPS